MQKKCTQCGLDFSYDQAEENYYRETGVPGPVDCPSCRRQLRLLFRNFFNLVHRECDLTGKKIISMYDTTVPFPVYELHEWWSDKWDGLQYGVDVNFSESLTDQLKKLHTTVPRMSIMNTQCENTDYCNMSTQSRNCYLVYGNVGNEDCYYGHIVWQSNNCFDCLYTYRCAFCYECVDCVQCHQVSFSRDCDNCSSSMFLVHCVGCSDCFGCVGLRNKQFHIFNKPHSREDYNAKIKQLNTGNCHTINLAKERIRLLTGKEIVKYYHGFNCEQVTGDYLYNCKNIVEGYDLKNCEDCRYCATIESMKDSSDCNFSGGSNSELCHQSLTIGGGNRVFFSHTCLNRSTNLYYCDNCFSCDTCFGCVGLKNKRYCIFNKQCTKEFYYELLPKLIEHAKKTGEWGKFFAPTLSPFGYNETIAFEYFPLTKEEVTERGWKWKEQENKQDNYLGPTMAIPEDIVDATDDICTKILICETSGKPYKIIPQELAFLRQMILPPPRKCFEQRLKERFAIRNPRKLWSRNCMKCDKGIETTYSPERPETVYCEECYLQMVY